MKTKKLLFVLFLFCGIMSVKAQSKFEESAAKTEKRIKARDAGKARVKASNKSYRTKVKTKPTSRPTVKFKNSKQITPKAPKPQAVKKGTATIVKPNM